MPKFLEFRNGNEAEAWIKRISVAVGCHWCTPIILNDGTYLCIAQEEAEPHMSPEEIASAVDLEDMSEGRKAELQDISEISLHRQRGDDFDKTRRMKP